MPEEDFASLPKMCSYEGSAHDLAHLRGLLIPTREVEKLVYVGERENIYVDDAELGRMRPWMHVAIIELDDAGNPITTGWTNAPPIGPQDPRAYSTAHIASLGMTDEELVRLAKEHLNEDYEPDGPGPSMKRREVYDRVLDKLIGEG